MWHAGCCRLVSGRAVFLSVWRFWPSCETLGSEYRHIFKLHLEGMTDFIVGEDLMTANLWPIWQYPQNVALNLFSVYKHGSKIKGMDIFAVSTYNIWSYFHDCFSDDFTDLSWILSAAYWYQSRDRPQHSPTLVPSDRFWTSCYFAASLRCT